MASSYTHPSTSFDVNMQASGALISKILKPLDEVLRCHICFDYFTNCMMTKCSHNYCSICIRRYMNYKSQCPTCFQVATEPELQNNRLIDEVLRIYKNIRETLQIPCDSISKSYPEQSSSSKSVANDNLKKSAKTESNHQSGSNQQSSEVTTSDEVACPVCYITVPTSRINIHLDSCLKQSEERSQRKFLPKLVYHLLSEKDIRKILKGHGLSTTGNKQALVRRHKNFIILYNANCDSLNPKPVSDLLLEIERQELEEKISASERPIQVDKRSDPELIEKEHESYVQEHKSQFSALIQDVQQRVLVQEHKSEINTLIQDVQQRLLGKSKEEINTSEDVSNITDESGNVIGQSTLKIVDASNEDPVIVKEEFSESLLQDAYLQLHSDNPENVVAKNSALLQNEFDSDYNTPQISFRIKKELPVVKTKEVSGVNQDLAVDNPVALDDFETNKMPLNRYPKKKYARRLSTEEKNSQRKK